MYFDFAFLLWQNSLIPFTELWLSENNKNVLFSLKGKLSPKIFKAAEALAVNTQ